MLNTNYFNLNKHRTQAVKLGLVLLLTTLYCWTSLVAQNAVNTYGSASTLGANCYRLTPSNPAQSGTTWSVATIDLNEDFSIKAGLNFGNNDSNGADGIVFAFKSPTANNTGTGGGQQGFGGIMPSLGVQFDTWENGNFGDPSYDHIAVTQNGSPDHASANNLAGFVQADPTSTNIEDGQEHDIRINWTAATNTLDIYFDCDLRLSYTSNIVNNIFSGNSNVQWGFIASTGGANNNHDVCDINVVTNVIETTQLNTCAGSVVTLNAPSSSSYVWTPTDFLNNPNIQNPWANPPVNTTYTVEVTDDCGETTEAIFEVTVNLLPELEVTGDFTLCAGETGILDAGAGYALYNWSGGGNTQSININTYGDYEVTVTDFNGCQKDTLVTVTQSDDLMPTIVGELGFCPEGSTTISTQQSFFSYQWSSGETTQAIEVDEAGEYTINIEDPNGCTGQSMVTVEEYETAPPEILGNLNICNGQTTTLSTTESYFLYVWSTDSNDEMIEVSEPGVYELEVYDFNFCTSQANVTVSAATIAEPTITGNTSFCNGDNTTLTVVETYTAYAWSNGEMTPNITVSEANDFAVTVTNENGCTAIQNISTTIEESFVPEITGNTTICEGENTTLSTSGGVSYAWSNGGTTADITVSPTENTTYTVEVTDGNGCIGTNSIEVVGNATPEPMITGSVSFCPDGNTTLGVADGYVTYQWSNGASASSIVVDVANTYGLTITDDNGCTGTTTVDITVQNALNPVISGDLSICPNGTTVLDAGAGFATYEWSNNTALQSIDVDVVGEYTVTVSDANGCTGEAMVMVEEWTPPTPAIEGLLTFCIAGNTTLSLANDYVSYAWNNGETTQTISINTVDEFAVTVTDVNGCTGTMSVNTSLLENLIPEITGDLVICEGSASTLSMVATYDSYEWSNGETSSSISTNTVGEYSITVSDASGCTGETSVNLTANTNPTPMIDGALSFCSGESTTLGTFLDYADYQWSNGESTPTITVAAPGNYNVLVTDENGCEGFANVAVSILSSPSVAIEGELSFCAGAMTTLTATDGLASYDWSTGAEEQSIQVEEGGNYSVLVSNEDGCTSETAVTVVENVAPPPVIEGDLDICGGETTTLSVASTYATYAWTNGATEAVITISPESDVVFECIVTDENGCESSNTVVILVEQNPEPEIAGSLTFCIGGSTLLSTVENYAIYEWEGGQAQPSIQVNTAGEYSVTVTNDAGCTGVATANIEIASELEPEILGNLNICGGGSTTLDVGNSYITWQWSNGLSGPMIEVTEADTYSVTVSDVSGCTGSASVEVQLFDDPTPAATGNTIFCESSSTDVSIFPEFATYEWSNGETTQAVTLETTEDLTFTVTDDNGCMGWGNVSVLELVPPIPMILGITEVCEGINTTLSVDGTWTAYAWSTGSEEETIEASASETPYEVTVTDLTGCTTIAITTVSEIAPPTVNILGINEVCEGENTTLSVDGTWTAYEWSTGSNEAIIEVFSDESPYQVTVTDLTGCTATATVSVTNFITQIPDIQGNTSFCVGESTMLTAANGEIYAWSTGTTGATITITESGTYTVTMTDDLGCTAISSLDVMTNDLPIPEIIGETELFAGQSIVLSLTENYMSYEWSTEDTTETTEVDTAGGYTVLVTDINNCQASDDITIELVAGNTLITPNAFSPNGDNRNDQFIVLGANIVALELYVYDRWGNPVFETQDLEIAWNGTRMESGEEVEIGLYVYYGSATFGDGEVRPFQGNVMVVR